MPYEKRGSNPPICIADEVPFEIPESWEWVRHNELFEVSGGSQPPKDKFISSPRHGYIRLYQIRDYGPNPVPVFIPEGTATKRTRKGDILLARYGASLGKVFWAEDGAYNVAMAKVIPLYTNNWILKEYLFLFYQSDLYQTIVHGHSRSAQAGFNKEDLSELFLPVPPFKEQRRIVQKFSELSLEIAKYDLAERQQTELRNQFPEQLKKSILQQAVMGKLVPQDEYDEPASVLLERIRTEKAALIKAGKLKKDKHESIIYRRGNSHYEKLDGVERCIDDEISFEIPDSWAWERFGNIMINRDSERVPLSIDERSKLDKIFDYYGASGVIDKVDNYLFDKPLLLIGEDGANLLNRSTPIAFIATGKYWVNNHAHVLDAPDGIILEYISLFINAMSLAKYVTGTAQPKMNQANMNSILIAVPPTKEQERIVAESYKVISVCNKL